MIFSSIVLYCGDTYIITELSVVVFVLLNAINWDHSLTVILDEIVRTSCQLITGPDIVMVRLGDWTD